MDTFSVAPKAAKDEERATKGLSETPTATSTLSLPFAEQAPSSSSPFVFFNESSIILSYLNSSPSISPSDRDGESLPMTTTVGGGSEILNSSSGSQWVEGSSPLMMICKGRKTETIVVVGGSEDGEKGCLGCYNRRATTRKGKWGVWVIQSMKWIEGG
ncbi:unnamed protein product [Lactuca saligna]|uniref:Uncharacterized protein n=1 Tax=Lactuca saligna TaxID=75948 RepID=A0AA35ZGC7_LACSI|nr:unnamed protein product [Lactuca saligna]